MPLNFHVENRTESWKNIGFPIFEPKASQFVAQPASFYVLLDSDFAEMLKMSEALNSPCFYPIGNWATKGVQNQEQSGFLQWLFAGSGQVTKQRQFLYARHRQPP